MEQIEKEIGELVERFSQIGKDAMGGVSRFLFDQHWQRAQHTLKGLFEANGFYAYFDKAGNLFGRIEGSQYPEEIILSGSHVDTVANGGKLDGQYGILAAYVAMRSLLKEYGIPKRTMEVVSFAEEEGSRFPFTFWGSKSMLGLTSLDQIKQLQDREGISFDQAMKEAGFHLEQVTKKEADIKAFFEIHIEQGGVLEKNKLPLGVVTAITGQKRYIVKIHGQANHAGTTPMVDRKDAVYAFSKICTWGIEEAGKVGEPLVLTFGQVNPSPNISNVVPGDVTFTIDCRHTDHVVMNEFTAMLEAYIKMVAAQMEMSVEIHCWMNDAPTPMDLKLVSLATAVCNKEGFDYKVMHSGAGHDAQIMAPHVPTAMFFVPSKDGISHNPAEETSVSDLAIGIAALKAVLYELAYQ